MSLLELFANSETDVVLMPREPGDLDPDYEAFDLQKFLGD